MSGIIPHRWMILLVVMLALLPVVINMTILHIAVPSMTLALSASTTEVLWIIDVYPLLMAGMLVPMGTLADHVGNRRMLLAGLIIFGLASLLAAFAPNPAMLIGARVLLALGGSMIMPCVLGIIRRAFKDEKERAFAMGLWGAVGATGAALGPLIGGMLLEHFWWGSAFLINVPIMLMVAPLVFFLLPNTDSTTPGTWAMGQALLLIAGILSIVYSIKAAAGATHPLAVALVVAVLGCGLLAIFARVQQRSVTPMLDLSLFSHPAILAGIIMATVATVALAGVELTIAQELQYVLGKTPLQAGIFMIPIMIAAAVGGPIASFLFNIYGLRVISSASLLLSAIALAFLAIADFYTPGFMVPAMLALLGLTLSIGLTASSIAIMSSVEPSKGAAAGALEATACELGAGLGISLFGVFMSTVFSRTISMPVDLDKGLAERAARSIGDSFVVAQSLIEPCSAVLIKAAKEAFSETHEILLMTSSALMGTLGILMFIMLRSYKGDK